MPSYVTPKKNTEFIFYAGLVSQADTKLLQSTPTLATGDVKVSTDGAAFANITTLPTVTPAAGRNVKVTLSAAEMNGDNISVQFVDAAGAEWSDVLVTIQTTAQQVDDLSTQASVNTIDDFVDTEIAAIKNKTDLIPAAPAAVGDIPTAIQNADALLKRDMSAVTGEAARSPLNAFRWLRNKWSIALGGTMTVCKEDDATSAWTAAMSQTAGNPVTGSDPA
jgi:hypothetical protein